MREKAFIVFILLCGVVGVAYGMTGPDNRAFVIGTALVVWGYLMIRRKLKKGLEENPPGRGEDGISRPPEEI